MPSLQPQIGLRDYLGYVLPGFVALSAYAVWNPQVLEVFKSNPVFASIAALVGGYIVGHVCKAVGEILLTPLRRRLGFNPYANVLGEKSRWGHMFRASLVAKLKEVLGVEMVEEELERKPSNVIILCWYSTMKNHSRGHDEVDRYISLFNLSLSMIPACAAVASVCVLRGLPYWAAAAAAGILVFTKYWYQYEAAFCYNVLRIWYVQNSDGRMTDG